MKLIRLTFLAATLLFASLANAQCKNLFKDALPSLTPYTHNGQLNTMTLPEGAVIDFKISCYKGMTYRINLVADAKLGKVTYKVLDEDRQEIYDSKSASSNVWDFAVSSSQDLTVEVHVPMSDKNQKGCVAMLVGFKPPKKSGGLR